MAIYTHYWGITLNSHSLMVLQHLGVLNHRQKSEIFNSLSTHIGRGTHTCVIIGSDNDLSPRRHQAIIWANAVILLIQPLETKFSEILIKIHTFYFKKMHLKMQAEKWRRPICLGLNVLRLKVTNTLKFQPTGSHWPLRFITIACVFITMTSLFRDMRDFATGGTSNWCYDCRAADVT